MKKDRPLTGQSSKSKVTIMLAEENNKDNTGIKEDAKYNTGSIKSTEQKSEMESNKKSSEKSESENTKNAPESDNLKPEEQKAALKSESQILESLTTARDLQKELGSDGTASLYAESVNAHDSGNEADVDTEVNGPNPGPKVRREPATREEVHREYAERMAERLTHAALLAGARDNITVMVVLLPGSGL
jgi:leucyl aminopeptidase